MELFKKQSYSPRPAELAAIEAPLADVPYLPDNLDITVFFGGHTTETDFQALKPYIRQSDVFIHEFAFWSPEEMALLSRISQGDKKARKEFLEYSDEPFPFTLGVTQELLGSKIRTTTLDMAAADVRADEIDRHFTEFRQESSSLIEAITPDYGETISRIVTLADREADIENYREEIMIKSIGPRLDALITNDSELQKKEKLNILLQLGTYHTYFYHQLSKLAHGNSTVTLRRVFYQPKPIIFDHFDRITRADRAGIELTATERYQLAERALGKAALVMDAIEAPFIETDYENGEIVVSPEKVVGRLKVDEIKMFHQFVVSVQEKHGHQPKTL
jgi:hypothetical protein